MFANSPDEICCPASSTLAITQRELANMFSWSSEFACLRNWRLVTTWPGNLPRGHVFVTTDLHDGATARRAY